MTTQQCEYSQIQTIKVASELRAITEQRDENLLREFGNNGNHLTPSDLYHLRRLVEQLTEQ